MNQATPQLQQPSGQTQYLMQSSNKWNLKTHHHSPKIPLKRYHKLWSQLTLHDSVLYCKVKTPTMEEEKLLLIVPTSLQKQLLQDVHDKAGHQGAERTMTWLSEAAYWVGIGKDTNKYCNSCVTSQRTKAASRHPAPPQPVVASRPWELVAVDILKVPMSHKGNQYMLVAQDYISKSGLLLFSPVRSDSSQHSTCLERPSIHTPNRLHSDQGKNYMLSELCKALE